MELTKIDNTNLWDKTYIILKNHIIKRVFAPNQKLSIPELAEKLGVSRTPLRDALTRLEMEGLVKTVAKVGTYVVAISESDVEHIMDIRLMLEFWVIEKIAAAEPSFVAERLNKLQNILDQAGQTISSSQYDQYLRADYNLDFHIEFMKMGQNPKNIDIYLTLMNYRFLTMKSSIVKSDTIHAAQTQHEDIVAAIRGGEIDDIRSVIRNHLDDAKSRLLKAIRNNGGTI